MRFKIARLTATLLLAATVGASTLVAAEIRGRVTDAAGQPIAGVSLRVTLLNTELTRDFQANTQGHFRLIGLGTNAHYMVACSAPGRVTGYALVLVSGPDAQTRNLRLLTPDEFSVQNPGLAVVWPGAEADLSGAEAYNEGMGQCNAHHYQEAAVEQFAKALALAGGKQARAEGRLADAQRLLGCALAELAGDAGTDRRDRAEQLLFQALQRKPDDAVVYQYLFDLLQTRKDRDGLVRLETLYVNRSPVIAFNRGVKAFNGQCLEAAVRRFQEALQLNPALTEAHYLLAVCEEELGAREQARAHFEAYLKAEPEGANAREARTRLARLGNR